MIKLIREKPGYKKAFRIIYKSGIVQEWYNDEDRYVIGYDEDKIKNLTVYIPGAFGEKKFASYEVLYDGNNIKEIDCYEYDINGNKRTLFRKEFYEKYDLNGNWTEYYEQSNHDKERRLMFKRCFEYESE